MRGCYLLGICNARKVKSVAPNSPLRTRPKIPKTPKAVLWLLALRRESLHLL